jgi:hypothetical protein
MRLCGNDVSVSKRGALRKAITYNTKSMGEHHDGITRVLAFENATFVKAVVAILLCARRPHSGAPLFDG